LDFLQLRLRNLSSPGMLPKTASCVETPVKLFHNPFQANAKAIETSSTMTSAIINIRS
jgi:hypothetical protein